MKKGEPRNPDGAGEAISIKFVMDDDTEFKALKVAQDLARKHGRRKAYIMAFLLCLSDLKVKTGHYPSIFDIQKALGTIGDQDGK